MALAFHFLCKFRDKTSRRLHVQYNSIEVNYMKVIVTMRFLSQYCCRAIVIMKRMNQFSNLIFLPRSGLNFTWNSHWTVTHFVVKVANKQTHLKSSSISKSKFFEHNHIILTFDTAGSYWEYQKVSKTLVFLLQQSKICPTTKYILKASCLKKKKN